MIRLTPSNRCWFGDVNRSHSLFDQFFGQPLSYDDLLPSLDYYPGYTYYVRLSPECQRSSTRPTFDRKCSGLQKREDEDKEFKVYLDVQQFKPEEVTVKTVDNFVVIEGKHEEKEDEHGCIQRHFIRKYLLPDGVKPETVKCSISSDGVLAITAPKQVAVKSSEEKIVPIIHSPYPAVRDVQSGEHGGAGQVAEKPGEIKSTEEKQESN